jgi:hypothetical protein
MDLTADEIFELEGLLAEMDQEEDPQVGPSADAISDFL